MVHSLFYSLLLLLFQFIYGCELDYRSFISAWWTFDAENSTLYIKKVSLIGILVV